MRAWVLVVIAAVGMPACTSARLRRSTIEQAGTLTELQYEQILNNLAMFCSNPSAMPWHVNLKDGSTQIADVGSISYLGDWHRAFVSHPSLLGSRTAVEQWGMTPVTDDTTIKLLRIAYRRAVGYDETLKEDDFANDLAHELKKQSPDLGEFMDQIDKSYEEEKMLARNQLYNKMIDQKPKFSGAFAPVTSFFGMLGSREFADFAFPTVRGNPRVHGNGFFKKEISLYENFLDETVSVTDEEIIEPWENIEKMHIFDVGRMKIEGVGLIKYNNLNYDKETNTYALDADNDPQKRVTFFAAEIRRQVKNVQKDLLKIGPGWYGVGNKKDVPPDARYVGKYRDCYVWVCPNGLEELTKFTIKILNFASLIKEPGLLNVPGPRFTPASGFPAL